MLKKTTLNNTLVLIDFDGTITNKDSFWEFIKFSTSFSRLILKLFEISPVISAYLFRLLNADSAKEKIFSAFFKGLDEKYLFEIGKKYCEKKIQKILRKDALQTLYNHKLLNHSICVVTASAKYWIQPWCKKHGFHLINTEYKIEKGKITGKYSGKNCKGIEKVNKILEKYDLANFNDIICYGDTSSDLPMLQLGTKKYYRFFNK